MRPLPKDNHLGYKIEALAGSLPFLPLLCQASRTTTNNMGRGDKKSRGGKIKMGSYGNKRPRKPSTGYFPKPEAEAQPEETKKVAKKK